MGSVAPTKTDRKLEDKMLAAAGDPERADVIGKARTFKRSWLELAEALTGVLERGSWEGWGYKSFDAYCKKELQIKHRRQAHRQLSISKIQRPNHHRAIAHQPRGANPRRQDRRLCAAGRRARCCR